MLTITSEGEEGLVRPKKGKSDPDVGSDAIMVMIPTMLDFLVSVSQAEKTGRVSPNFFDLYQAPVGTRGLLTLSGPFLGAPQAVLGMEKLIALGAKRVWVLGWCGSLQSRLRIGDIVIPTSAISEEGTSQHYPIGNKRRETEEKLVRRLEDCLKREELDFSKGAVWTTDAPYRETPSKVADYNGRGVLAVEMEMSALITLAAYRGVKLAGLLVVSDELFDMKWRTGFSNPKLERTSRLAGKILLNLVEKN